MQQTRIGLLILALLLVSFLAFGLWRRGEGRVSESSLAKQPAMAEFMPDQPGRASAPVMTPRLVANWAAQVEDYTVCVSSIRSSIDGRRPMPGMSADPRRGVGPFYIVIQILGVKPHDPLPTIDARSVRAVDDRGGVYTFEDSIPDSGKPLPIDGGIACVVPMRHPDAGARWFRTVDGVVLLDKGVRKPFRVSDLILPVARTPRIYGRLVPLRLSAEKEKPLPDGLVVLKESSAERTMSGSRPASKGILALPQRLIFAAEEWARFTVPLPGEADNVEIKASPGHIGSIDVDIRLAEISWKGRVWDSDTLLIILPRQPGEGRKAAAIRLSRDPFYLPDPAPAAATFTPGPEEPGGSIISRVLIGHKPFGRGSVEVEISRLESGVWTEPRVTNVPIKPDGTMWLSNVAPGVYTIRRSPLGLAASLPTGSAPATLAAYLEDRFGVTDGEWEGETAKDVKVVGGARTSIPELRFKPNAVSTVKSH
jgi:hypothetical protein